MDYQEFLKSKSNLEGNFGFDPIYMPDRLFDFQKYITEWGLKKGRAAVFAERDLWEKVVLNDVLYAPMPTGSDSDMKALFELGEPQQDSTVDLSELTETINQYNEASELIKQMEVGKKQRYQEIIAAMGTSKYGETNNCKVTFSRFNRSNFNKAKFQKENPGVLDSYITTSETGRLSVKNI